MLHRMLIVALVTVLLGPVAYAGQGSPQGKNQGQSQGQGQGKSNDHGKIVSECNHRANERKLKGKERQDFVEWCTDKTERHGFNDWRWHDDRACYEKADSKGLKDAERRDFVRRCVDRNADDYERKSKAGGKDGDKDKQKD